MLQTYTADNHTNDSDDGEFKSAIQQPLQGASLYKHTRSKTPWSGTPHL